MRTILFLLLIVGVSALWGAGAMAGEGASALGQPQDAGIEETIDASTDPFVIPSALKTIIEEKKAALLVRPPEEPAEPVVAQQEPDPEPLPPPELPKVSLTGVVYGVEKPLAVINGQVFAEGEGIKVPNNGGVIQVHSISAGRVVLLYMGVEHTITIDEQGDSKSGQ